MVTPGRHSPGINSYHCIACLERGSVLLFACFSYAAVDYGPVKYWCGNMIAGHVQKVSDITQVFFFFFIK